MLCGVSVNGHTFSATPSSSASSSSSSSSVVLWILTYFTFLFLHTPSPLPSSLPPPHTPALLSSYLPPSLLSPMKHQIISFSVCVCVAIPFFLDGSPHLPPAPYRRRYNVSVADGVAPSCRTRTRENRAEIERGEFYRARPATMLTLFYAHSLA